MTDEEGKRRRAIADLLMVEERAKRDERYWRARGDEPSQFTKETLAKCAELRAAGAFGPYEYVAAAPNGRYIAVTAAERAELLRAGARSTEGDA